MRKFIIIIVIPVVLYSCGGSKDNIPPPVIPPAKTTLISPAQNTVCETGTVISATTSSVAFSWNASQHTDKYQLNVTNLLTMATASVTTSQTDASVSLTRNAPFSWYVVSRSGATADTAHSVTWKFYNSGPGVVSYAPFPATIIAPTYGQVISVTSGAITLQWSGSSVTPGSIANYDVYFGTTTTPALYKSETTATSLSGVPVTSGTTYYWEVITRDVLGDTSSSGVYTFTVN